MARLKAVSNKGRQHTWCLHLPALLQHWTGQEQPGAPGPWGLNAWLSSTRGCFGVPGPLTQANSSGDLSKPGPANQENQPPTQLPGMLAGHLTSGLGMPFPSNPC